MLTTIISDIMTEINGTIATVTFVFGDQIDNLITAIAPIALFGAVLFLILRYGKTIVNYVTSLFSNN